MFATFSPLFSPRPFPSVFISLSAGLEGSTLHVNRSQQSCEGMCGRKPVSIDWELSQGRVHYGAHTHGWVTQLNRCSWQQHEVYYKDLQFWKEDETFMFCSAYNVSEECGKEQWQTLCFCSSYNRSCSVCWWQAVLDLRGFLVFPILSAAAYLRMRDLL